MARVQVATLDWLAVSLLVIGALNWAVIGVLELNALEAGIDMIFQAGPAEVVTRTIYVLIGAAGLYVFYPLYRIRRRRSTEATAVSTE